LSNPSKGKEKGESDERLEAQSLHTRYGEAYLEWAYSMCSPIVKEKCEAVKTHVVAHREKYAAAVVGMIAIVGAAFYLLSGNELKESMCPETHNSTKGKKLRFQAGKSRSGTARQVALPKARRFIVSDDDMLEDRGGSWLEESGNQGPPYKRDQELVAPPVPPSVLDPALVAASRNAVQRAKVRARNYRATHEEKLRFRAAVATAHESLISESALGKEPLDFQAIAPSVYKLDFGDMFVTSASVVCDKVVVPLHGVSEKSASVSIENYANNADLRGDVVPLQSAPDLGYYPTHGAVAAHKWFCRAPENETVAMFGFGKHPEKSEPGMAVGVCSAEGLYNAPTFPGDCGGPVVACSDGKLIGFHIAGGTTVNRFVPMTPDLAKELSVPHGLALSTPAF
jgi:hypothetical protein